MAAVPTFPDVPRENPNFSAIEYLAHTAVFKGYPNGRFELEREMNRAELMTISVRNLGIQPDPAVYKDCFPDVTTQWFAPYVCYAKSLAFVEGYASGEFLPGQAVTEAEALKIILRPSYGQEIDAQTKEQVKAIAYPSTPVQDWEYPYIAFAESQNLLMYAYGSQAPRAEIAEILFRFKVTSENQWKAYHPFLRNELFIKKGLSELLPHVPACSRLGPADKWVFDAFYAKSALKSFLESKYAGIQPLTWQAAYPFFGNLSLCRFADQSLLASVAVRTGEETVSSHVVYWDPTGQVLREDSVSCPKSTSSFSITNPDPRYSIPGFDFEHVNSFEFLSCKHLKVGESIYYGHYKMYPVDPATFVILEEPYSKDAEDVFWHNQPFQSEDEFPVDPSSFESLGDPLSRDKHHVYFKQHHLQGFDPSTFKALGTGYGKDDHQIFDPYFWKEGRALPQDVATFEVINYTYTKDQAQVYLNYEGKRNQLILGADPLSFEALLSPEEDRFTPFGKDAQAIYYQGKLLKSHGLDLASVEWLGGNLLKDAQGHTCRAKAYDSFAVCLVE